MIDLYLYYDRKSIPELKVGLDSFLRYGYVDKDSFEDSNDDAFKCLLSLSTKDKAMSLEYSKKFFEDHKFVNEYLRAICFENLMIDMPNYALTTLRTTSSELSVPVLAKVFEYLFFSKNNLDALKIDNHLLEKLKARYQEVRNYPDAKFYHLDEIYNDYIKAYSIS